MTSGRAKAFLGYIAILLAWSVVARAHDLMPADKLNTNQFDYIYEAPKNPAHQPIYESLKKARVLEKLQEILSPIRFPIKVTLKTRGCDGIVNATFWDDAIQVCYEYFEYVLQQMPKAEKMGLSRRDALIGPAIDVFLHETGHAVLEVLEIPFFGREEDSADYFASFVLLQFPREDAYRLILGASFLGGKEMHDDQGKAPELRLMGDAHSLPAVRYFNRLCMAYGFDPELYAAAKTVGGLPETRAKNCRYEYKTNEYAFRTLITPYIDQELLKKVKAKKWFEFESPLPAALKPTAAADAPK
jgi:hypothetical protein